MLRQTVEARRTAREGRDRQGRTDGSEWPNRAAATSSAGVPEAQDPSPSPETGTDLVLWRAPACTCFMCRLLEADSHHGRSRTVLAKVARTMLSARRRLAELRPAGWRR